MYAAAKMFDIKPMVFTFSVKASRIDGETYSFSFVTLLTAVDYEQSALNR